MGSILWWIQLIPDYLCPYCWCADFVYKNIVFLGVDFRSLRHIMLLIIVVDLLIDFGWLIYFSQFRKQKNELSTLISVLIILQLNLPIMKNLVMINNIMNTLKLPEFWFLLWYMLWLESYLWSFIKRRRVQTLYLIRSSGSAFLAMSR